jgi:hypothetical protein
MWRGTHDVTKKQPNQKWACYFLFINSSFLLQPAPSGDLYCIFLFIIFSLKSLWQIRLNSVLLNHIVTQLKNEWDCSVLFIYSSIFWRQHRKVICIRNFLGVSNWWNICCRFSLMANLFLRITAAYRIRSRWFELSCWFYFASWYLSFHRLWARTRKTLSIPQSIGLIADTSEMGRLCHDDQFFLIFFFRKRRQVICIVFSCLISF